MIKVSDDVANEFGDSAHGLNYSSDNYDIESFFGLEKPQEAYQQDSQFEQIQDMQSDVNDCVVFFKSKAGRFFINRIQAIRQERINDFSEAKPEELLKVQAEFNAWSNVLNTLFDLESEKLHLQSILDDL